MMDKKNEFSPFTKELLGSMEEGLAYLKGTDPARVTTLTMPDPPPGISREAIRELRNRYAMTQTQFARLVNVSAKTVEGWEQGIRVPGGAALRMLQVIGNPMVLSPLTEQNGIMISLTGQPTPQKRMRPAKKTERVPGRR